MTHCINAFLTFAGGDDDPDVNGNSTRSYKTLDAVRVAFEGNLGMVDVRTEPKVVRIGMLGVARREEGRQSMGSSSSSKSNALPRLPRFSRIVCSRITNSER